jgi:hypothetical protein
MTAAAGDFPGGTWLVYSDADEAGSHWWPNPVCASAGNDPTCLFLGADGSPHQVSVFQDRQARDVWKAADNATDAEVTATVQVTSCPNGTTSCPSWAWGPATPFKPHESRIRSHLEFVQYYPNHAVCATNVTPDADYLITDSEHHFPIAYHLHAPVLSTCGGSRNFELAVIVTWLGGNAVKIDSGSNPTAFHSITNTSAVNRIWTVATTTVPNVVGGTEADAGPILQRFNLVPGAVTRVVNSAQPGTVVSQNSPSGTVEPTGSPVDLVVSQGSRTVPNVVHMGRTSAMNTINNAGLTVGAVTDVNNCLDVDTVQNQSIAPNTQVAPGTAVDIGVSTCTGTGPGGGTDGGGPRQPV